MDLLPYLIDGGLDVRYDDRTKCKLLDDWYIKNSLQNHQSNIKKENPGK